jgi:hypothetical protein
VTLRVPRLVASPLYDECPVSKANLSEAGPPDHIEERFKGGKAWRVFGCDAHRMSPDAALRFGGRIKINPLVDKSLSSLNKFYFRPHVNRLLRCPSGHIKVRDSLG